MTRAQQGLARRRDRHPRTCCYLRLDFRVKGTLFEGWVSGFAAPKAFRGYILHIFYRRCRVEDLKVLLRCYGSSFAVHDLGRDQLGVGLATALALGTDSLSLSFSLFISIYLVPPPSPSLSLSLS